MMAIFVFSREVPNYDTLLSSRSKHMGSIVLIDFIMKPCDGEHPEDNAGSRLTDQEAIRTVCEITSCKNVQEIGG